MREQRERPGLLVAVKARRDQHRPGTRQAKPHQVEVAPPLDDRPVAESLGRRRNRRVPAGHVVAEHHSPQHCHVCRRRAPRIGSTTDGRPRPGPPRRVTDGNGARPPAGRASGARPRHPAIHRRSVQPSGGQGDRPRARAPQGHLPLRPRPYLAGLLSAGRCRLHPDEHAVRLALPGRAGVDHQRATGLVRGRPELQRADAGHHRLRRDVSGQSLRARHRRHRGDRRHPDGRAHHRHHLHPLRPPVGAGSVLGQGGHLTARRRPARDVPDGQLAPQPGSSRRASARSCWSPSGRARGT